MEEPPAGCHTVQEQGAQRCAHAAAGAHTAHRQALTSGLTWLDLSTKAVEVSFSSMGKTA